MEHKGFATGGVNYSVDDLDKIKYQKDFGPFQLEILGHRSMNRKSKTVTPSTVSLPSGTRTSKQA